MDNEDGDVDNESNDEDEEDEDEQVMMEVFPETQLLYNNFTIFITKTTSITYDNIK